MKIYNIMTEIKNSGETGQELLIDSFVIGVEVGRKALVEMDRILELVQTLRKLKGLLQEGAISGFTRDAFINYFLNSPIADLKETFCKFVQGAKHQQCSICQQGYQGKVTYMTQTCFHTMHEQCFALKSYAQFYQEKKVDCPTCQIDLNEIDKEQIKGLYDRYEKQLKPSICPKSGCDETFFYYQRHFQCKKCNTKYCLNCQVQAHQGKSCEEFLRSRNKARPVQPFVLGSNFKECIKCHMFLPLDAQEDSSVLYCQMCKTNQCFQCAKPVVECKCRSESGFFKKILKYRLPFHRSERKQQ